MVGRLTRIFCLTLAVLPFGMGAVYALVNLSGGWEFLFPRHAYAFYFLTEFPHPVVLSGLVLALFSALALFCARRCPETGGRRRIVAFALAVFAVALALRVLVVLFSWNDMCPSTDFGMAWMRACGKTVPNDYHRFCPAWVNFSLLLRGVVMCCGENLNCALLVGAVFGAMTAAVICLMAYEAFESDGWALLAGLLFAVNPSHVLYVTTLTPEHEAVMFYALSIGLICRIFRTTDTGRQLGLAMLAGGTLGMGEVFKPFSAVILVALSAFAAVHVFTSPQRCRKWKSAAGVVAVVALVSVTSAMPVAFLSARIMNVNLVAGEKLPHMLFVGLNRQGEGQIHMGPMGRIYLHACMAGVPPEIARRTVLRRVLDDWKGHGREIIPFFIKKTIWAWQDDNASNYYFLQNREAPLSSRAPWVKKAFYRCVAAYGQTVEGAWYMVLMAFACLGAVCGVRGRPNRTMLFLGLVIFGYFCMILLSEAQTRYKCLIIPCITVYAAAGLAWLYGLVERIRGRRASAR